MITRVENTRVAAVENRWRSLSGAIVLFFVVLATLSASVSGAEDAKEKYEVGGPLAGVPLPLYPTYFGEPLGKPGDSRGAPQLQLYPGSVENWRAYWFKYLPVRSVFDRQSQLKNWVAPNIPGCSSKKTAKFAQPVYRAHHHAGATFSGHREPPVDIVEIAPGDTIIDTSTDVLPIGMYCVRVIAAVRMKDNTNYRKDLIGVFTVDDGNDDSLSMYKMRIPYVDQFYSIMEFYFHATSKRSYKIKISVATESKINILVHNVSLDDVFTGFVRRSIKKSSVNPVSAKVIANYKKWLAETAADPARLAALEKSDESVWNGFPRLNTNYNWNIRPRMQPFPGLNKHARYGFDGMTHTQIEKKYGRWKAGATYHAANNDVLMTLGKLKLSYTMEDLYKYAPLPDPYPFKDAGYGISKPDGDGEHGWFYAPVGARVLERITGYQNAFSKVSKYPEKDFLSPMYVKGVHCALLKLIRFAYGYPALDAKQDVASIILMNGPFGRQSSTRQRMTTPWFLSWYTQYGEQLMEYDRLYELIMADPLLVKAVSKHVPWVKSSNDIIKLLDMYLVQNVARKIMRYQYYTFPDCLVKAAITLGDKDVTNDWMKFAFTKSFRYGCPPQGLDVLLDNLADRSGLAYKGSTFYSLGEAECVAADILEKYSEVTGTKKYKMYNKYHPHTIDGCHTPILLNYAGFEFPRIGDVTGPDKPPGALLRNSFRNFKLGWKYTKNPIFAPIIKHLVGSKGYSDEEVKEIDEAAAKFKRMPYLDQKSRFIPNWCGILETGKRHDDFRFRRGAMVRAGYGYGHHHNDELDLQIAAHGVLMTVDGGQRPGYAKPPCRLSTLHNTVTVNDKSRSLGLGGVTNVVDTENFAYMNVYGGKQDQSGFTGKRQVMLVDVDDDGPARTLPIENQKPGVKLKPVGTVPNGYVIDVFRQPGHGKLTYNFHAMINDSFEWNAIDAKKSPLDSLGKPTKPGAPNFNPVTGTAPETLIATWRMRRLPVPPLQRRGTEKQWLGVNFDPKSPRKFLKLRLLGVGKAKLFKEDVVTVKKGIQNSFTRVAATVQDMNGRVFAALIEPYAGKPFVKSAELLKIQGAGDGVNEPVAMRMECVNGRKDVVFVNASSKKEYAFDDVKVKGEAAMTAVDSQGLKYAMLTSGTSLTTPYVKIKLNKSHYAGKIKSIDFYAKKLTLDTKWKTPESANGGLLAIRGAKHTAVYNVEKFIGSGDDQLILKGSPFLAVLPVKTVFPEFGSVKCSIPPRTPVALSAEWTATNQKGTKAWRVKKLSDNMVALDGKVEDGDFPDGKLILWDIGVGYSVTMPTWATVRRVAPGKFIVKANTTATVSMKGTVEYSTGDGKWRKATVENGWSVIELNTDK